MDFHGDGFFTVDTPKFKSQYSQVIWHTLAPTPLPEDIVKKFDGKVMSVTGWEVDVLRDVNGTATPVPCYESYNHHYGGALVGKGTDLEIVNPPDDEPMVGHGGPRETARLLEAEGARRARVPRAAARLRPRAGAQRSRHAREHVATGQPGVRHTRPGQHGLPRTGPPGLPAAR